MAICILLATTSLLSIIAHYPASAGLQTQAAVAKWIGYMDSNDLKEILMKANTPGGGVFTWRSTDTWVDQWLVRWDRRSPSEIFTTGFIPTTHLERAIEDENKQAMDLRTYVESGNISSVFVSTSRVGSDRRPWTPTNRTNIFRYDIFAAGGIEVNPTLGPHRYQDQNQIVFVGGIRTRYIVGALEYDERMRQFRYHENKHYEEPFPQSFRHCGVPHVIYRSTTLGVVSRPFCVSSSNITNGDSNNHNDIMRSQGGPDNPETSCSYCYIVSSSIYFSQPEDPGSYLEPYGEIKVYIPGTSQNVTVWKESYYQAEIPAVQVGQPVIGKCAILQADTPKNPRVCFAGKVAEYDPWPNPDEDISNFSNTSCNKTNSQDHSYTYVITNTDEGSISINFKVLPCCWCNSDTGSCCNF